MRKIALILAMLLIPCVSFAGLLGSSSSTTPVSKEYKQQLMDPLSTSRSSRKNVRSISTSKWASNINCSTAIKSVNIPAA
ncbi:membrane protein [Escherichia coli]|uniref:Membrane protein n=1 Tax=Escherichia coli TaxID=562 RepID=A0A377F8Z0_ECOLX|nr:membrane protein [Escherichia coli]